MTSRADSGRPTIAGGFGAALNRLRLAYVGYGVQRFPPAVARRLRLANGVSILGTFVAFLFGLGYALIDWPLYWPIVLAIWLLGLCTIVTPLFHRFGETAAVTYYCIANAIVFIIQCLVVGTVSGAHFFLLAGPVVMLFLGARRSTLSFVLTAMLVGTFLLIEFSFPIYSTIVPVDPETASVNKALSIIGSSVFIFASIFYALRIAENAEAALEREYSRSENLLLNLMPTSIAARLKERPDDIIADHFDAVTILFADIVGFTPRSNLLSPNELVRFLNRVFSEFDALAEKYRLEKIKTIGDAYMVAGGMPDRRDGHASAVADMALDMQAVVERLRHELDDSLAVRIGIHTGPAVAGVIGTRKLFYDVWGDTVNTASRMESHGSAGRIQVTGEAKAALGPDYLFERRGVVDVKGKGEMELWYLTGRRA